MTLEKLLQINDLTVELDTPLGPLEVVKNIRFTLPIEGSLAIVGESGSGKTITAKTIMALLPPLARVKAGQILFAGRDITSLSEVEYAQIRGQKIGMVFQDPATALNPTMKIGKQVFEGAFQKEKSKKEALNKTIELLDAVGLSNCFHKYPHELSGGMKQRALIALALGGNPELLIADEPTSALDPITKAQILDLLKRIQKNLGIGLVLITHDLGVAAHLCEKAAIMYGGRILEEAPIKEIRSKPQHPYTQGLWASLPSIKGPLKLQPIPGTPPTLDHIRKGCPFEPRCPHPMAVCIEQFPDPFIVKGDHLISCWLKTNSFLSDKLSGEGDNYS